MRQAGIAASFVAALLAGIAAASPAAEESSACADLPPDLAGICERGVLRVARYGGERPPFFFQTEDGTWRGFDIDIAEDIAANLGVAAVPVTAADFNEVVDLVARREADIGISKLSITLARSKRVRFSKPYMTVYQTLLVNRLAAPKQEDPFAFLNRAPVRIGALDGSSYMDYARREFGAADLAGYTDFEQMMSDVANHQLDAVFVDSARANTWRRENPQRLIKVRAFVARDRRDLLAFAVNWRDTHLLAWLDLYLDRIRDDGSAERLYRKWFVDTDAAGVEP